jgi:hypothetical protein
MGFIEIIFMGTLGALFVLLALLIYHYKRQLNKLETKYDTMFEIINSLVKEVYKCKSDISESRMIQVQSVPNKTTPAYMLDHLVAGLPFTQNDANDSDSEEGSSIEGDDDDESDDADDADSESEQEPEYKQIYMAVEPEPEPVQEPVEEEKQEYKQIFLTAEPEKEPETINVVLTDLDVEEVVPPLAPVVPPTAVADEDNDDIISVLTNDRRKPYSKMNMQELKQEVQFQGITTDISKMKKQDIVQLLRTHKQGESS